MVRIRQQPVCVLVQLATMAATNLSCLPEDCLALILACTTPAEASRLACVSRAFAAAFHSDTMWENLLPSNYCQIYSSSILCKKNANDGSGHVRKKDIVEWLARGVYLSNGLQRYLLLPKSGTVCRMLSVADMNVAWRHDVKSWRWEDSKTSHFGKIAHLLAVTWLEVRGKWSCSLPPGVYSVTWRLKVANPWGGRAHFLSWKEPLWFTVSSSDGQDLFRHLDLSQAPKRGYEEWFEFEVGQITIRGPRLCVTHLNLEFDIKELDCSYWKGGLYLDCLTLRPTACIDDIYKNSHDEKYVSRLRGRPGVF